MKGCVLHMYNFSIALNKYIIWHIPLQLFIGNFVHFALNSTHMKVTLVGTKPLASINQRRLCNIHWLRKTLQPSFLYRITFGSHRILFNLCYTSSTSSLWICGHRIKIEHNLKSTHFCVDGCHLLDKEWHIIFYNMRLLLHYSVLFL